MSSRTAVASDLILTTPRLRLRRLRASDQKIVEGELNTPEVTVHLGGVGAQKGLFKWLLDDQQEEYGHTFWPIELKHSAEFLGICGLVTVDEQDSTVLGATELGQLPRRAAPKGGVRSRILRERAPSCPCSARSALLRHRGCRGFGSKACS